MSTIWVQAMGLSGISKSQASKLCKEIDERVHVFLDQFLTYWNNSNCPLLPVLPNNR